MALLGVHPRQAVHESCGCLLPTLPLPSRKQPTAQLAASAPGNCLFPLLCGRNSGRTQRLTRHASPAAELHTAHLFPSPAHRARAAGITLLGVVAIILVVLAFLMRRKDRRHLQRLQREALERAEAAMAAHRRFLAEQAERAAKLVIPVVIMQPDGTCLLAEKLKDDSGSTSDGDGSLRDVESGLATKPAVPAAAPAVAPALERTASGSHEPFYIESVVPAELAGPAAEGGASCSSSSSSSFALDSAASRASRAPLVGAS